MASGTGAVLTPSGSSEDTETYVFGTIEGETFSVSDLSLAAGTYYLQLSDEVLSGSGFGNWVLTTNADNRDSAYQVSGSTINDKTYSMSFQILGSAVSVPGPSSLSVVVAGLVGLGVLRRRRKTV